MFAELTSYERTDVLTGTVVPFTAMLANHERIKAMVYPEDEDLINGPDPGEIDTDINSPDFQRDTDVVLNVGDTDTDSQTSSSNPK